MLGRLAVCFILSLSLISCASLDSENKAIKSVYDTGVVVPVYEGFFVGKKELIDTSSCSIQTSESGNIEMDIITVSKLDGSASIVFGDDKEKEFAGEVTGYKKEKNDKASVYVVQKMPGYNVAYLMDFKQEMRKVNENDTSENPEMEAIPGEKTATGKVMIMEEVSKGEFVDCAEYELLLHSAEKPAGWIPPVENSDTAE